MNPSTIVNDTRIVPPMSPDEVVVSDRVLTTTRAIRRRLDLTRTVDPNTIEECIRVATHAPSAENMQNWRWVVVTEPALREKIADSYYMAYVVHRSGSGGRVLRKGKATRDKKVIDSVGWLAKNLREVPALVIPCVLGRPPKSGTLGNRGRVDLDHMANVVYYGSVLPAIWSFQLAARSRGLGSVITCMHLPFEADLSELLGIPRAVTQICLLPVAHITGESLGPASRAEPAIGWNGWSSDF